MIKAVLFDLDDTLFDHRQSSRTALGAVRACHPSLSSVPVATLERSHAQYLEEIHGEVLAGRIGLDDARRQRFRRLFGSAGHEPDNDLVERAAVTYRDRYRTARVAMDGAIDLLRLVRGRARVGVVTNNLLDEQQDKLRFCKLDSFVNVLVASEEAGVSKPDPRIFELALHRLQCEAGDVVMVGDSWAADVIGARAAGIRAIWFNPEGLAVPRGGEPVEELRTLNPPEPALRMIFDAHRD